MEDEAIKLPPLPEPDMSHEKARDDCTEEYSYSAEAVQAYARQAVLAERERCAKIADKWKVYSPKNWNEVGQTDTAEAVAAAIRSGHSITETARPEE